MSIVYFCSTDAYRDISEYVVIDLQVRFVNTNAFADARKVVVLTLADIEF